MKQGFVNFWDFWFPALMLVAFGVYCAGRLVAVHFDPEVATIDYSFEIETDGRRGSIMDAKGNRLAQSLTVWEYRLDPVALTNRTVIYKKSEPPRTKEAIVKTIATQLGLEYRKVLAMANSPHKTGWRSQYLATSADRNVHDTLANSRLVAGVSITEKQVRQYVHRRRLSHVLGSVNAEGQGSAGLEQRYNRLMTGTKGQIRGKRDATGQELYDKREVSIDAKPGADVRLTIDNNLQYEAETALADGVREFEAGSGWCIVMNAKTGALLAMASYPDFDPILFGRASDAAKLNRTCAITYEPGSVMKVITACAGLDLGFITPESRYTTNRDDDRYYRLPGDGSHVWEPTMTIADAVVHSSNIVIGKLGFDLGPERLWNYMRAFGFGSKCGVELPGEEAGILPNWKRWDKVKWSRAPIGQGVAVTALQLVSAYQAIANNGVRMKPHLVNSVVAADGSVLYQHVDEPIGRPIKPETAKAARAMMRGVASREGTARRAAVRGYSVAGKTGTAQKVVNGKYSDSLYRATFCGMVPAGEPELVILVTLDFDKRTKYHQGGNSAAPIFRRIATGALRYLMIPPDKPDELEDDDVYDEFDQMMDDRSLRNSEAEPWDA